MGKSTLHKASKKAFVRFLNLLLVFSLIIPYFTIPSDVFAYTFPSTNELNKNKQTPGRVGQVAPYVDVVSTEVGKVTLQFFNYASGQACFEYRSDGQSSQYGNIYPHPVIEEDFYFKYYCIPTQQTLTKVFNANEYVEIRLAFGAERDWDFDWTRFDVLAKPTTPVLQSPIDEAYINDNTPLMQWSDSTVIGGTIKAYYYRIYHHCTNPSNIPGSCSVWPNTTGLPRTISELQAGTTADGEYYWQVKAVDNNDTESDWSELEKFTIDTKVPSTPGVLGYKNPITQCKGYTNIKNTTVDWSDSDGTGSPIKGYEYQINYPVNGGRGLWTPFFATSNSQYTGSLNEGRHYIRVRAQDMAGNWSSWSQDWINPSNLTDEEKDANCSIEYDSIVPTTPTGLYFWDVDNNNAVQCGGYSNTKHIKEYWNPVLDINLLRYEYSSFNAPNGTPGLIQSPFTTNFFDSSWWMIPKEGTYGFQVRAIDKAGNVSGWALNNIVGIQNGCTINIDWTAPETPSLISPDNNSIIKGDILTNSWSSVPDAGYYEYESYNDEALQNLRWKQKVYTTSKTAYNVPDATFWWRVRAIDLAENASPWSEVWKVTVDNTLPLLIEVEDINLEDEEEIPTALVTITETNIDQLCFTLEGPLGDHPESCIDITGDFDVISTILNKYGKSGLTHVDTDQLPIDDYILNYYVTDKAGNESSSYEFTLTISKKLTGLENALQQVLGTQTNNGGTNRNTRATVRAVDRLTELLGTGGPEEGDVVLTQLTDENEVKGVQTCDNPSVFSGYIYLDSNGNNQKDENENIYSNIPLRIYTVVDGTEETVKQIKTDDKGYWQTELCTGEYFVKADGTTLPDNFVLGEDTIQINVDENSDISTDFPVLDERNFLQKYWPWLLLAIGALGGTAIVFLNPRRKRFSA